MRYTGEVTFFSLLQNFDAGGFWPLYGLSHQSALLDAAGIFFAEYAAYVWAIILALVFMLPSEHKIKNRTAIIISIVAAFIARYVVKTAIVLSLPRPRPFLALSPVQPLIATLPWENMQSFPSGHAILFFALAASLYGFNKKIGLWAFLFAAMISIARIYAGVHWPSDILAGAVLGVLTGWLVYRFYRNNAEYIDTKMSAVFRRMPF